jgi:hypothetical protein
VRASLSLNAFRRFDRHRDDIQGPQYFAASTAPALAAA